MKRMMIFCILALVAGLAGCDATMADRSFGQFNSPHHITVYSGGKAVADYHSIGAVHSEDHSDGWYFIDAKTNHMIQVSGTLTIEEE